MPESLEDQLTRVQTAIAAIESGAQSYSIAGRSLSRADLETLYRREQFLLGRIARRDGGGIRVRLGTPV